MTDISHSELFYKDAKDNKSENTANKTSNTLQSEQQFAKTLHHLENCKAIRQDYFSIKNKKRKWFWQKDLTQKDLHEENSTVVENARQNYHPEQESRKHNEEKNIKLAKITAKTVMVGSVAASVASTPSFAALSTSETAVTTKIFGMFQSGESLLKTFCILLAIGSASLPFVAYNFRVDSLNTINNNENILENVNFKPDEGWFKREYFEPIDKVDPNAEKETDLTKAIMSNGKGRPQAEQEPIESTNDLQQMAVLEPSHIAYKVKDVSNGMALIEYEHGYWFASPGSRLPDGSLYLRPKTNTTTGKIELHTSQGVVVVEK